MNLMRKYLSVSSTSGRIDNSYEILSEYLPENRESRVFEKGLFIWRFDR